MVLIDGFSNGEGANLVRNNGGRSDRPEHLWTLSDLSDYLNIPVSSLYKMMPSITVADGKRRVRHQWRFDPLAVKARVKAGLFGLGLDENGEKPQK